MRRSFMHLALVPTLLSLLCLVFSGGLSQAQKEGSVEGLQKYLDTYEPSPTEAQGKDDPTVADKAEASDPPRSMFADKAALVVRVMPASYHTDNMDRRPDAPYTWPGRALVVWGRVDGGTAPYTFQMEFGDGSAPVTGNVDGTVGRKAKYIAVAHAYATGGPKLARLTVTDASSQTASRDISIYVEPVTGDERTHDMLVRRNAAVQDGLRWLYLQQASNGSWPPGGGYWAGQTHAATASALAAFEMQGYYPSDDPTTQIYAEFLRAGLESLFPGLVMQAIGAQTWGNPDSNGDGYGLRSNYYCGAYLHGLMMYAIALSREPNAVAVSGGAGIAGRTYREILTNMVDQLAYSQGDNGAYEGGWRYNVCTPNDQADNSAVQWATIGLDAAEIPANGFEIHAPSFVKSELKKWLVYSRSSDGGYGYTSPGGNTARTGSGMFSEFYCGLNIDMADPANDPKILTSRAYLEARWCVNSCNDYQFAGNYYAIYAVKKALNDLNIVYLVPPQTRDWYADYVHFLVKDYTTPCASNSYHQVVSHTTPSLEGDGYWPIGCYTMNSILPSTCFALLTLIQGVSCDLYASATGDVAACPGVPVSFDGSGSHSTCPGDQVSEWRWDFDDQDGADVSQPDATGPTATNPNGYPLAPDVAADSVYATLWVIDNASPPDTAMTKHMVVVTRVNHPPVACLNGPFTACVGDPIYLDGCCSYDPDTGTPCGPDEIVLYEWDLGGDGSIDFTSTTCRAPSPIIYNEEKTVSVVLWVTDSRGARSLQAASNLIWSSFRDLRVTAADIEFVPGYPQCGAEGQIRARIHATVQGGAPPIAETKVRIYHDQYVPQSPAQNLICEQILTNLVDGQVAEVLCSWAPPAPTEIIVVADAANQVQECVETDNVASKLWQCGCLAGASLVLPTQWSLDWQQGDGGTVRWYLGGNGEFDVSGVDPASLLLNGTVPTIQTVILPEMEGFVGPVLVARFSRWEAMRSCVQEPGPQDVTLTGGFLGSPSQCLVATSTTVLVATEGQPAGAPEEAAGVSDFGIRAVRPNPMAGGTEIEFGVPTAGLVNLGIFDAGGRLVRTLAQGSFTKGYHKTTWNGRNNDGQPVSAGVYFVRGQYADKQVDKRIVVVQ